MATHDYIISNASGAAVRADLNNALAAIVSNNSSATEPATTYAYQWWADTTAGLLKLRNSTNDGWNVISDLDGGNFMEDGTAALPGLPFTNDLNTGLFRPAADQLGISTGGVERVEFGTTEVVFNDGGADVDFRVEGDTEPNLLYVDAGNERVGIGASNPAYMLDVTEDSGASIVGRFNNTGSTSAYMTVQASGTTLGAVRFGVTGDEMSLWSGSTETMRLDSSNNVGVGTTAPGSRLQVTGSAGSDSRIHIESTSAGASGFIGSGSGLLLTAAGMNTTSKFTPAIQFGSTDPQFTTTNPKVGAAINGIAAESFTTDTDGAMNLAFYTTPINPGTGQTTTERMRINYDGKIGINTDSPAVELDVAGDIRSSTGILFGTDTAAANTLDDYEEGTWTPVFAGDGGTLGSYTYAVQSGTYTKVGNLVTAICYLEGITQVSGGNGKAKVTGLPFANGDSYTANGSVTLSFFAVSASATSCLGAQVSSGATEVKFRRTRESLNSVLVDESDMISGSADIWFAITYRVA